MVLTNGCSGSNGSKRFNGSRGFHDWQYDDNIKYIKSFIGSDIEFQELEGNRVIGTLERCDNHSFYLIGAVVDRRDFGDYVIHDYEIRKWKLKEWRKRTVDSNKYRPQPKPDSSKLLIPPQFEERDEDDYRSVDENYVSSELESIDLKEDDDPIDINLKHLTQKASTLIRLIDKMDDDLDSIIDSIIQSKCVGFGLFGREISREGSVDLMAFANEEAIYVFDANNADIVCRLKQLLESNDLQKVMSSLRHSSDALYHLFGIVLKNAVDVRINDFFLQTKQLAKTHINPRLQSRPELRSFDKLLLVYFGLKTPNLYRNVDYRCLSVRVENVIKVKIVFLRELLAIINYKLLEEMFQMNDRFLRSLRSANDLEFVAMRADEREVELLEHPINECEEMEKRIINLMSFKPIRNGTNGYHNSNEPLIRHNSKPKTNGNV